MATSVDVSAVVSELIECALLFRSELCMFAFAAVVYLIGIGFNVQPRPPSPGDDPLKPNVSECDDPDVNKRHGVDSQQFASEAGSCKHCVDEAPLSEAWALLLCRRVLAKRSWVGLCVAMPVVTIAAFVITRLRQSGHQSPPTPSDTVDAQLPPVTLTPTPAFIDASFSSLEQAGDGDNGVRRMAKKTQAGDAMQSTKGSPITRAQELLPKAESMVIRCGSVAAQIDKLRLDNIKPDDATVAQAVKSFHALRELEEPFRATVSQLTAVMQGLNTTVAELSHEEGQAEADGMMEQSYVMRSAARDCLLGAVRRAHALSMHLARSPLQGETPFNCAEGLLTNVETLALAESAEEDDADLMFILGLYWSEASTSGAKTPCFADTLNRGALARDAHGVYAPRGIVRAEELLARAEIESFEDYQPERRSARASQLYEHATFLESEHLDAAAEWRYRDASLLGAQLHRPRLAAHSLARLSAMLMSTSNKKSALAAANEALQFDQDPLALYLQTSLRLSIGAYSTGAELREAARKLKSLAGQLPFDDLEAQRVVWAEELALWDAVGEGGLSACLALGDVAKIMICIVGRFAL